MGQDALKSLLDYIYIVSMWWWMKCVGESVTAPVPVAMSWWVRHSHSPCGHVLVSQSQPLWPCVGESVTVTAPVAMCWWVSHSPCPCGCGQVLFLVTRITFWAGSLWAKTHSHIVCEITFYSSSEHLLYILRHVYKQLYMHCTCFNHHKCFFYLGEVHCWTMHIIVILETVSFFFGS